MSKLIIAIALILSFTAAANAQMFNPQPDPPAAHRTSGH
jgi:hypothetical protein